MRSLIAMMAALLCFSPLSHAQAPAGNGPKAVLVTGASVQLNEGHAYIYDRDTLVKMLDEALAGARPRTVAAPAPAK